MSVNPAVSIIIPAYNTAPFIGEALESVFRQSYADYEAIVVNDGSTDDLERVLEPFRDRIIYVRQENRGLSGARNTGLRLARGRYAALLDSDDIWMPDYLQKMVKRLEADPGIDVLSPNAVLFGLPRWEGKLFQDLYPPGEPVTFEKLLTLESRVFISVMFKRELVERVGLFDESLREGAEDFDLWLRMAQQGCRFAFVTEPLVRYRKRAGSLSSNEVRSARSVIAVYEKVLASPEASARERELIAPQIAARRAQLSRGLSKQMILAQDFAGAAQHLTKANTHFRSVKLALVATGLRIAPRLVAKLIEKSLAEQA